MVENSWPNPQLLWVRFIKNCDEFYFDRTLFGPFKAGVSFLLPKVVAIKKIDEQVAVIDIEEMSIKEITTCFDLEDFEKCFDRKKIIDYLFAKVDSFNEEILKKTKCDKCGKDLILKIKTDKDFSKEYNFCPFCDRYEEEKRLVSSQFENWVISTTVHNIFQGRMQEEVCQSLKVESTNRSLDFGDCSRIPENSTISEMLERVTEKLCRFNKLMALLINGIDCNVLLVDDAYARKTHPKKKKQNKHTSEKPKPRKKRFFYAIVTLDMSTRFILNIYISTYRDKAKFRVAYRETNRLLRRGLPRHIAGDKLRAQMVSADEYYPPDKVVHHFHKRTPKTKGICIINERKIKDIRKTLKKRQKYADLKGLQNRSTLALIGQNYLRPYYPKKPKKVKDKPSLEETKKPCSDPLDEPPFPYPYNEKLGKTAAQLLNIPYPVDFWNWRPFMIWVNWVNEHITEILMAGSK